MKTSDIAFEEVEAEVIEPTLAVRPQDFAIDHETVRKRIERVCETATKALDSADELAITDEELGKLDGSIAKNFATSLNKDIKAVEEARKELKSECTQPVADMEAKLKALMKPVAELQARYKARQGQAEEQERVAKLMKLRQYYEDMAPMIALPLDGCDSALVPFERIENPRWGNKTFAVTKCQKEVDALVEDIASKQKTLDGMALSHREDAEAAFWATLSIEAALQRDQEITAREERRAALEKAQSEMAQSIEQAAEQKVSEEEPVITYIFRVTCTERQKDRITKALQDMGIHGSYGREL